MNPIEDVMEEEIAKLQPAAAYVRMSTDHQKYSTSNQLAIIRKYAEEKKMEIVEIFADEGKSGLQIKGRESVERMFSIVESGNAKFKHILVYDVSRWGRFQDADEAAYYEFRCKKIGIQVHYCAEMFPNDGSLISNLSKGLKRVMAGEYCRELSEKGLEDNVINQVGIPPRWTYRIWVEESFS